MEEKSVVHVPMSRYETECAYIWELSRYLKSLSPKKITVRISEKKSGVFIKDGQTEHQQNTIEHYHFVQIPSNYFCIESAYVDAEIYYVADVSAFVSTLTEKEKKIFVPSMPFLQAYHWCGPSEYIPCDPKDIENIQRKVNSIQYILNKNV